MPRNIDPDRRRESITLSLPHIVVCLLREDADRRNTSISAVALSALGPYVRRRLRARRQKG